MHRLVERKEILEKEFFKKGATNGQPTAEYLSCIHANHEEPNFVEKNQVINNTQMHSARTDQATPPLSFPLLIMAARHQLVPLGTYTAFRPQD